MHRRSLSTLLALSLAALLLSGGAGPAVAQDAAAQSPAAPPPSAAPATPPPPLRALDFTPFAGAIAALTAERRTQLDAIVKEATFADLQAAMAAGTLTSVELTTYDLARIQALDVGGLQAVTELNPDALTIAAALDAERAAGTVRGPLHGIPVTLKDNIGTADAMHTTAGAAAMAGHRTAADATVAARLRAAGAVILGKASMSEWAGYIAPRNPGFSTLGGQTVNPLDPRLPTYGSSSGSAVGTSANLFPASIGTETMGSIVAPASINGVVGMHPSVGLVSRAGVIPLSGALDTPGPITRSVTDAAVLLTAMAGPDPADALTTDAGALTGTDFTTFLDPLALKGKRIGIYLGIDKPDSLPDVLPDNVRADLYKQLGLSAAVVGLLGAGADVELVWGRAPDNSADVATLLQNDFRLGFADHMAATDPSFPIQTLADVVAFNETDPARYAPYGQADLVKAAASTLSREETQAIAERLRTEARAWLDGVMAAQQLDAITGVAQSLATMYAPAGYPAITVPMVAGQGLTFTTGYLQDGAAIGYAYAFEQATHVREHFGPSLP